MDHGQGQMSVPCAALRGRPQAPCCRYAGDLRTATDQKVDYVPVTAATATADVGEDGPPASLTPVLWAVAVASMGVLAFGYHLGVVNGPLNAIAADLGFAGNAGLQGAVTTACSRLSSTP